MNNWKDCLNALLDLKEGLTKGELDFVERIYDSTKHDEWISPKAQKIIIEIYDRRYL